MSVAHGYAKATGEPMACVLHSNVGLMHGMMGIYNAWCDRAPMIVLGATGPIDTAQAPAVDRLDSHHPRPGRVGALASSNGTICRPRPTGPGRGACAAATSDPQTAPTAPVYICLDAGFQESRLEKEPEWPDLAALRAARPAASGQRAVEQGGALLVAAQNAR